MTEGECLSLMVPPTKRRPPPAFLGGIIQVCLTSSCDRACVNCTQLSQLRRKPWFMTLEQIEQSLESLKGYFGVVAFFGGNPCLHPQFAEACALMRKHVPLLRRGLWSNNPLTLEKAEICRRTFNAWHSNINAHQDKKAAALWNEGWPEANPLCVDADSRHTPTYVAMKDLGIPEEKRWELISKCDVNQNWSAMIAVFRGKLRAWFCEIAGSQSMLHQDEPDYPDTGLDPMKMYAKSNDPPYETLPWGSGFPASGSWTLKHWWELGMDAYVGQVRKHCHECGIPLRGYGSNANDPDGVEQVSPTHAANYVPKQKGRRVEIVTTSEQLGDRLKTMLDYVGNGRRPKEHVVEPAGKG